MFAVAVQSQHVCGTLSSDSTATKGQFVAIEVKRKGNIDAVDQLLRYIECLDRDSTMAPVRGVLVAQTIVPQAKMYANSKGIKWVEVDYDELRGMAPDELRLF